MRCKLQYVLTKILYSSLCFVCALGFMTVSGEAALQSGKGKVVKNNNAQTPTADTKNVMELFKEGVLIARALTVRSNNSALLDYTEFKNEFEFLKTERRGGGENIHDKEKFGEGSRQNVERHGQRSRSATLLVPGLEMSLLKPIGFLYNADKSTIRAYMIQDSTTRFQNIHEGYYNVDSDKSKFEPILDRKKFIEKYKEWRNNIDHLTEKQRISQFGLKGLYTHNEIIGNFFSDSLVGLVAEADTLENKLKLLGLYQYMKKELNQDLPMVILNKGQLIIWKPNLKEIAELANEIPKIVEKIRLNIARKPYKQKVKVFQEFLEDLGYKLKGFQLINKWAKWKINEKDLVPIDTPASNSKPSLMAKKIKNKLFPLDE